MKRLFVTKLTSVGAVDAGDNPESKIMLFKRKPSGDIAANQETTMVDTPTIEQIEKLQTELAEANAQIEALTAPVSDPIAEADPVVQKRFEDQQAEIVKLQKAADAHAAELAKERDQRLDAEFAKTAEKYVRVLGDDGGPILKDISVNTGSYQKLTEALDRVVAVLDTSDIFKELGVSGDGDPVAQIEALAKEKQKDNPKLSQAQARQLARTERPDLKAAERAVR